jgi:hypothetical protein
LLGGLTPLSHLYSLFVFVFHPQTGTLEIFFRIQMSMRMQKVIDTYGQIILQRMGIHPRSLRFLLNSRLISPDETPKMLELRDQDWIDCILEQVSVCLCV